MKAMLSKMVWNPLNKLQGLDSLRDCPFFQRISKSELRSDWGGWVGYSQMDVRISKSVGHKN